MNNSPEERLQMIVNDLDESNRAIIGLMMAANLKADDKPEGMERSKCYDCAHMREVAGNAHIKCVKPDVQMTGQQHGIRNGWFMYPLLFDPTWMTKECVNFESVSLVRESSGKSE